MSILSSIRYIHLFFDPTNVYIHDNIATGGGEVAYGRLLIQEIIGKSGPTVVRIKILNKHFGRYLPVS